MLGKGYIHNFYDVRPYWSVIPPIDRCGCRCNHCIYTWDYISTTDTITDIGWIGKKQNIPSLDEVNKELAKFTKKQTGPRCSNCGMLIKKVDTMIGHSGGFYCDWCFENKPIDKQKETKEQLTKGSICLRKQKNPCV